MCYQTIKGILGSHYVCYLNIFLEKNSKVKFLIFFLMGGFFSCGIIVRSLRIVVGRSRF